MKTNPPDIIKMDVPLFIRLLEFAREEAKTDMELHDVASNIIKLSTSGNVITMEQYDEIIKPRKINKEMKKKLNESQRMQQLAGILMESEGFEEEFDDYGENEEMPAPGDLEEMARSADTGGAYTITPEGEDVLRKAKAAQAAGEQNILPPGVTASQLAILAYLYKAKKEGKRVQKKDYAAERNTQQPAVNNTFNKLEQGNFITREQYVSKSPTYNKGTGTPKPRMKPEDVLGQLDLD